MTLRQTKKSITFQKYLSASRFLNFELLKININIAQIAQLKHSIKLFLLHLLS